MDRSHFLFVCFLGAVSIGADCGDDADEPETPGPNTPNNPANPNNPTNPNNPNLPAGGNGPLSGTWYWTDAGNLDIHKLNLATGVDTLLGHGGSVSKAPDGKFVFRGSDLNESPDETFATSRIIVKTNYDDIGEDSNNSFVNPKVSPDGTKVAYETLDGNTYVVSRADGAVLGRFEPTGATDRVLRPTWLPDGRIVVAGGFGNQGLFVSDAEFKTLTRIDPNLDYPDSPAASPDGKTIAFNLKGSVHTIAIDGTGLRRIDVDNVDDPTDSELDRLPTWSPDGKYISYGRLGRIYIRPAEGGAEVDVLETIPGLKDKILAFSSSQQWDWQP